MSRILVIRLTALGDVAMTVPVIHALATQYPQHEIVMLSHKQMAPLFSRLPENITFVGADIKGIHHSILGINKLFKQLRAMQFDYVADLHKTLRSDVVAARFRWMGIPVVQIDKGRMGKYRLTRKKNKIVERQKDSFKRYADVFEELGFPLMLNFTSIYGESTGDIDNIKQITGDKKSENKWVGIAPFAKHNGKIYPIEKMEKVVAHFSKAANVKVFLFGGGIKEEAVFADWKSRYPTLEIMAGRLDLAKELNLMSHLDVMLSMDSANMHLASLVNTQVISIWGQTHPYAGFLGWKQLPVNIIQVNLPCRPCSVYGNKKCYRKDFACMNQILPETVIQKVEHCIK